MYTSRPIVRVPTVYRVVRAPAARNMSVFSQAAFFPRFQQLSFQGLNHNLNDLFRMMDEFATNARSFDHFIAPPHLRATAPAFQPRFDVREQDGVYELRGELPGLKGSDLSVEFTDAQTLVIRGKTEQELTRGDLPTSTQSSASSIKLAPTTMMSGAVVSSPAETSNVTAVDNSDNASVRSNSSYQKPSVEDEDAVADLQSLPSSGRATPAESVDVAKTAELQDFAATATQPPQEIPQQQALPGQSRSQSWTSERSIGSFQRVFQFHGKINHDAIKASLRDGLLTMTIPKSPAPGVRRINVE